MTDTSPEKIVYFVRHGQSEANVAPVFQGPESPLSEKGKWQADLIAERVAKLTFDTLISSPVTRTKQTAEAVARATGKMLEYSDLFAESIKPSRIHGKSYEDAVAESLWRRWAESLFTPGLRAEDGENYEDIVARADKALAFLHARPEQRLVIVTHSFFLQTIICRVLLGETLTPKNFKTFDTAILAAENTSISALRYEGAFEEDPRWRVWIYNDHAHLG